MTSTVSWKDGMAFNGELGGFDVPLDADEKFGGVGYGPAPKGLMLTALVGCTGMDVIAILTKMKIAPTKFTVDAEATLTSEHPKVFDQIRVIYRFEGEDLNEAKLQRAVQLSQEKYCGVSAMLRPIAQLSRSIYVNGSLLCVKDDPPPVVRPGAA
ncbi:MAG: osmotically inducible protein C [Deltaproteobacteria bacterium HGW-Deltaproteobacteria-14]|nr:MAG: osmotically inducible protein C [Deltaproteobacteria bacterium HGW-Deltaproteobacteria-14]